MRHNPLKKLAIRLSVAAVIFGLLCFVFWMMELPYFTAWSGMFTLLLYKTTLRKVM